MTLEHQRRHIEAELERAKNALRAAQELHKLGLYSDAVSRQTTIDFSSSPRKAPATKSASRKASAKSQLAF